MWNLNLTILLVSGGMFRTVTSQTCFSVGGRMFDDVIANHLASEFERSSTKVYPKGFNCMC